MRVTRSGGFTLGKVFYTLPSRMIGHVLTVRVYDDRIELYNCRHVTRSLQRKPMALKDWVHRDQLFPRDAYRRAYDEIVAKHGDRRACVRRRRPARAGPRTGCERALAERIDAVLDAGGIPDPKALTRELAPARARRLRHHPVVAKVRWTATTASSATATATAPPTRRSAPAPAVRKGDAR